MIATIESRHDSAFDAGRYAEASGWSRLAWVAEPANGRWRAQLGLDLLRLALESRAAGDTRALARAARQARAALSPFAIPSGNTEFDQLIESAEALYGEACEALGTARPIAYRSGADVDLIDEWMASLDAFQLRMVDIVRLTGGGS